MGRVRGKSWMEENTRLKLKLLVSYFAIYVIWGSTYIGVAIALETIPVCFIGGFRFTFAGLVRRPDRKSVV